MTKEKEGDCVSRLMKKHSRNPEPPVKKIMEDCGVDKGKEMNTLTGMYHSARDEDQKNIAKRAGLHILKLKKKERDEKHGEVW